MSNDMAHPKRTAIWFSTSFMLLLLLFLINVGVLVMAAKIRHFDQRAELASVDKRLFEEFLRYDFAKGLDLAFFKLPESNEDLVSWVTALESSFHHAVAAFGERDEGLIWAGQSVPEEVVNWTKEVLASPETGNERVFAEVGSALIWHKMHEVSDTMYSLWMVRQEPESNRWGVLFPHTQAWSAFFKNLNRPPKSGLRFWEPAWMLRTTMALPVSGETSTKVGLRAHIGDSVVFSSPGLTETDDSLKVEHRFGPSIEYYAGPLNRTYRQARMLWIVGGLSIVFSLIVCGLLYIGIRNLKQRLN